MNNLISHLAVPPVFATIYAGDIPPMVFGICAFLFVTGLFWFRTYTGLSRRQAFFVLLGCTIACGYRSHVNLSENFVEPTHTLVTRHANEFEVVAAAVGAGAVIIFVAALILRLWGRWVGGKETAEERLPGLPGVRAWFCSSNVTIAVLIVVCAWFGDGISPLLSAAGLSALFAAAPLLRMDSPAAAPTPAPAVEDLSAEREKIVSMLVAGKLTADESAELLQALGASKTAPERKVELTGGQRLMLIGAALVTLGFFLPWFVMNPGAEVGNMMNQMQKSMGPAFEGMSLPNLPFKTSSVSISGGDIGHGLGWATLALALAAALLPYVATTLEEATARTLRMLCLGVGGVIVLYLFTQNIRFVGVGLCVVMTGYAAEVIGMVRGRTRAAI